MSLPTLRLPARLEGPLSAGHPWVYRDHVASGTSLADGTWVRVEAGRTVALGLWASDGAIAVRVFRRGTADAPPQVPDAPWVEATVARALALRAGLEEAGSDAYRLVFGEGDGLPGITVDRYGRFAALQTYASGYGREGSDGAALLRLVVRSLARAVPLTGVLRARREDAPAQAEWGAEPPPELTVREQGLRFLANLFEGQKTGLFLDHREHRAHVRELARGRRVANLFAYSGAFSVYALAGGALHAVDVDVAPAALRDAERNVAANVEAIGTDATERHETLRADLLSDPAAALAAPQLAGSDLIVLDPPSLARRKGQRHAALRTYRRLNAAALAALPEGGLLATASCTAQVSHEAFLAALAEAAAEAGVCAQVLRESGHAPDHPVPLSFPEGRYLKFVVLRVTRPV
jgi:23S rRNA (cytosine1962-C5)-methyltransferase